MKGEKVNNFFFPVKGPIAHFLGSVGHRVSVAASQLCW